MKRTIQLVSVLAFACMHLVSNAQIKVISGGRMSIGSTTAPATGFRQQVTGKTLFTSSGGTPTTAPFIRGSYSTNSTAALPDYSWYGDTTTGIFHGASQQIQFSIGGTEALRLAGSYVNVTKNSVFSSVIGGSNSAAMIRTLNAYSTATNPDYTWWYNDQVGMFHPASNVIGFTTAGNEDMRITSTKVGIGSTNPQRKFVVSNSGAEGIEISPFTGYNQIISYNRSGSAFIPLVLQDATGGNVGIGTTAPGYKLHVNGMGYFNGNLAVVGNVAVNGSGTYTGTWTVSDQMFKTEIDTLSNALAIIRQLKPRTYFMDTVNYDHFNFESSKQHGFIAQELQQVLPELVKSTTSLAEFDSTGTQVHPQLSYSAINYTELISILTKGLQELDADVAKQDSLTEAKDAELQAMQAQINHLQSLIEACCSIDRSVQQEQSKAEPATNDALSIKNNTMLYQNKPNPFHDRTEIDYYIPTNCTQASIIVFDMQGKLIKTFTLEQKEKGSIKIEGSSLRPGMYMYSLVVDNKEVDTKRMILTE